MSESITIDGRKRIVPLAAPSATEESWLKIVERQVSGLKFGSVAITVHEGRVVQVETNSKLRFDRP